MKIFGIGLSRTGTSSLHSILSQLDYRSAHCILELLDGPDWSLIDNYDAVCDTPIPMLWKECDQRYPGSKFILTTRSINSWLKSMQWMFSFGAKYWDWEEKSHQYHQEFYGTKTFNEEILERHWHNYHNDIANYFSTRPQDLLVINLETGFNLHQLCDFLEIPFREISIGRENERRESTLYQKVRYYILKVFGRSWMKSNFYRRVRFYIQKVFGRQLEYIKTI